MHNGSHIVAMSGNIWNLSEGFEFVRVPLVFEQGRYVNVFADKNNKTLAETLEHSRYAKLKPAVLEGYAGSLDQPLGKFLLEIKKLGDPFFRHFLNKYGDLQYSKFSILNTEFLLQRGVYAYRAGDDLMYIGRCRDQMKKRINQGYGKIHPKNCYLDGQATNCHLNSRVTSSESKISLWLCKMDDADEIVAKERRLIQTYKPPWNIQR